MKHSEEIALKISQKNEQKKVTNPSFICLQVSFTTKVH